MTMHVCLACRGDRKICPDCRSVHRGREAWRLCQSRRKRIPCPGITPTPEETGLAVPAAIPHFETFIECDVCRVRALGLVSEVRHRLAWASIENPNAASPLDPQSLHLCAACLERHGAIQKMTLEYLMGDRGGLCMGQWA